MIFLDFLNVTYVILYKKKIPAYLINQKKKKQAYSFSLNLHFSEYCTTKIFCICTSVNS